MTSESDRKTVETRKPIVTCPVCGQPAMLEESWDLHSCGSAVALIVRCPCCGSVMESPYARTENPPG